MAKPSITFTMESHKEEYEAALDEVAEVVLTKWGMEAESAAKKLAPVDTGLLRNSITWALAGSEPNTKTYTDKEKKQSGRYKGQAPADKGGNPRSVHVGTNVKYAPYQEFGDYKHAHGQSPFLKPAIEKSRGKFRDILEAELKNAMRND